MGLGSRLGARRVSESVFFFFLVGQLVSWSPCWLRWLVGWLVGCLTACMPGFTPHPPLQGDHPYRPAAACS